MMMGKANINNINYLFILLILIICSYMVKEGRGCIYIFGDSTVDVGTNNLLVGSYALANFPYNGIDFPNSIPTGRFSNGYNLADQLAMLYGYEMSPKPYLYLINETSNITEQMANGINFASGGSGIVPQTGQKLWNRTVSLGEQIDQFGFVCGNMSETNNNKEETLKMISNSTYIISVGSNDILDPFRLGTNVSKEDLIPLLQGAYAQQIQKLYNLGARKFGIIAPGPLGCCPSMRAMNKTQTGEGGCLRPANDLARAFYNSVDIMLKNMSSKLPQFKYSLANSYKMGKFILNNYKSYGFNDTVNACCGSGDYNGGGFCDKEKNPNFCGDRGTHLFWDLYHLSQSATNLSAISLYYGFLNFVKPISFKQLEDIQI